MNYIIFQSKTRVWLNTYLKSNKKCDAIAMSSSPLSPEDNTLYNLNGLSPSYQAFKTSIWTNLQPISLDGFYALLCSKEINIANDASKELSISNEQQLALISRGRGRNRFNYKGRGNNNSVRLTIIQSITSNSIIQCRSKCVF